MKFSEIYNKAFVGGYWMVGLQDSKSEALIYKKVPASRGQWIADPFLFEDNGRHFLFVEQYFNRLNRAGLGVYEIVDGKPINNNVIIDNPYHMSYPCVFKYKGNYWMIPESSSNQSLNLYKASEFPLKWEQEKTLIEGRRVVDTTVFVKGNDIYLLSYEKVSDGWQLLLYKLDMDTYSLSKISETIYNTNIGRPAGRLFEKDGKLYRPAQNCSTKYGESLFIYEVTELSDNSYEEQFAYEIKCSDIEFEERFERIHTLNCDSRYKVVDVFQEQFDFFHWWKIFKRQFLKK
jgi:hypothetical protein